MDKSDARSTYKWRGSEKKKLESTRELMSTLPILTFLRCLEGGEEG